MKTIERMRNKNLSRRDVLKYSLTALLAMNFGCSIRELLKSDGNKVALIYGTKYGSTGDTAQDAVFIRTDF